MAYEFEHGEALPEAVERVAREQLEAALAWLDVAAGDPPGSGVASSVSEEGSSEDADDPPPRTSDDSDGSGTPALDAAVAAHVAAEVDPDAGVEAAVHEARKCCKRIRGLVRLVRPAMEDAYHAANTATRDAARELSPIRDAHALLDTFDDVVAAHADQVPQGGLPTVRQALADRADEATDHVTSNLDRISNARDLLSSVRVAVAEWPLHDLDPDAARQAVADGIAKTAGRGRRRFREVEDGDGPASDELLHQWRKRVKYSWYHVSLLEPAAAMLLATHADALHDLSDALGDDHDLAILSADLRDGDGEFGDPRQVHAALVLVDGTRRDLQWRAVGLGARLHAEQADAMGARLAALLAAWDRHGPELPTGEISELFGTVDDLGDRTSGELRELARSIDLPGRSRLDRAGLLAALRAAGTA